MCGINGIFAYHYAANTVDRRELARTRDHMAARGPDGCGAWMAANGRVGFGHRRLSIIDPTDAGAQPMASADGRFVITFNGAIYNFRELRRRLELRGAQFASNSDTEVLLHLYRAHGAAMVHELRGMFAFAIWDAEAEQMFLARDAYGIKPLYYSDDGWTFRFASQVKALVAGGGISLEPDAAGHVGFYIWGSVPEPFTTHRHIHILPAGTTLLIDRIGAHTPAQYHNIAAAYYDAECDASVAPDVTGQAHAALTEAVASHLVADVPVGAFLSAGIDSGAILGLMRDAGARGLSSVTLSFSDFKGTPADEAPIAAMTAARYGARHTTRRVDEPEFRADLPRILEAMDQPSIDGINTWFVAKAAREQGLKVAISGLGGDELFGGYPSFATIPRRVRRFAAIGAVPGLGRGIRALAGPISRRLPVHPKAASLLEFGGTFAGAYLLQRGLFLPSELGQVLDRDFIVDGLARLAAMRRINETIMPLPASHFARVAVLESALYMRNQLLRDTDWAAMAHGVEVRTPLVDSVLLRRLAPLALHGVTEWSKKILATAPSRPLPDEIISRPKTGFITPIADWLDAIECSDCAAIAPAAVDRRAPSEPWARTWARIVGDSFFSHDAKLAEAA